MVFENLGCQGTVMVLKRYCVIGFFENLGCQGTVMVLKRYCVNGFQKILCKWFSKDTV